eukprot:Skav212099  [mRNA]  locus=scaffold686:18299:19548:+ [translate_table: standard]
MACVDPLSGLCCAPVPSGNGKSRYPLARGWERIAEPLFGESQVVPIPRLCPESVPRDPFKAGRRPQRIRTDVLESRFLVELREVLDLSMASFWVSNVDGGQLKVKIAAGGILAINQVEGEDPDIILRAGSGHKRMLTIMEGNGSYFGKIESSDGEGLILYHMQKPCAAITADVSNLSMQVHPFSADAKFILAGSTTKRGDKLRIQVAKQFDALLLLGCFLGIIILEPELMAHAFSA